MTIGGKEDLNFIIQPSPSRFSGTKSTRRTIYENVTRLQQPPPQSGSTRSVSEAEDITPDTTVVNKRTRVKLSQESLDLSSIPNKGQLFVVAGTLGWFVAIPSFPSPLADLRSQLSSQDANSDNTFQPQRTIPFSSVTPTYLVFACNDPRLIVGLTQGLVIVSDAFAICSTGTNEVTPLHTFLPTTPTPTAVRQMYANPGDIPDLVALLREPDGTPDSQLVEVINVSTLQSVAGWSSGGTPETFPFPGLPRANSSPSPFRAAILSRFLSETQQAKTFVARPSVQGQSIVHTTWLSNPAFYTIVSPVGPLDPQADQKHMAIVHDTKRSDASADITLPITFFPSGVRPPGAFTITLKGWDPSKIFLVIGDSTTADIGLVCCTADDKWQKLSLDESAPSMLLDVDQNETIMIGFELDLKNTTPYDITTSTGETVSVPPPPVVWVYASHGTVIAWYLVNTRGTPYPGMGQLAVRPPVVAPAAAAVPASSPFSAQPTFGQSSQPAFRLPILSGQPTFGNPAFGAASSTFTSPPGQAPSGGAFAAFPPASVNWGQPAQTGFDSAAAPAHQIRPAGSTEPMATDSSQELSFGMMSLGGSTDDTQAKAGPATTIATSTIGGGSFALSPGVGFAKFVSKLAHETTAPASVEVPRPSPAFGQTSFASGFATHINPTSSSTFGSGGGFGAFAGRAHDVWRSKAGGDKVGYPCNQPKWGFGAFASTGLSAFGQAALNKLDAVPAWKTGGDATFISGTGATVFGGTPSTSPLAPATTPVKSLFTSTKPTTTTTLTASPLSATTLSEKRKLASPFASTAGLFTGVKPGAFNLVPKSKPITGTQPAVATGPSLVSSLDSKPGAAAPALAATGGKGTMNTPARVSTAPPLVTPSKDAPSGQPLNPIQIEFTNLITGIGTELANVSRLSHFLVFPLSIAYVALRLTRHSHEAHEKQSKIRLTPPVGVEGLTKAIHESEQDIEQLELTRSEDHATIRELEIGVLKGLWPICQGAPEGLIPEQSELQTQLRRNIQVGSRAALRLAPVQVPYLRVSPPSPSKIVSPKWRTIYKKKLNEFKTGRPSVNSSPLGTPSCTRERDVVRRPLDVTLHIASTIAAALNAEQSAHRLKEVLLAVCTEPLLNTRATHAKPAPRAFDTPQRQSIDLTPSA
ncbi:hypothetical protein EDB86DRAFT_3093628 [Lactarius hatsudake]|nr:hypothetical protein EDB86DRAFT_3093628 [Lactarius hatsudake]